MKNQRAVATGGLTLVAAGVVAAALIWGGGEPAEQRDTRPAGQVETEDTTTTTTTPAVEAPAEPAPVDNGPMDAPEDTPVPPTQAGPEVAPGNPVGDVAPRPAPAPVEDPVPAGPVETPTEVYQGPPTPQASTGQ